MDLTLPLDRTCANCACVKRIPVGDGLEQLLCRRNPPLVVQQRVQNSVLAGRSGDVSQSIQAMLTYPPTDATLTCWDWQPPGSRPGDRFTPDDVAICIAKWRQEQALKESGLGPAT